MSFIAYHNMIASFTKDLYNSHKELIRKLCNELGCPERVEEFADKYLDETTKTKPKRDEHRPKKNLSSYFFFVQASRKTIGEQLQSASNNTLSARELNVLIIKTCGERWKQLTDDEKQPFILLAQQDKERYDNANKQYQQELFFTETGEMGQSSAT